MHGSLLHHAIAWVFVFQGLSEADPARLALKVDE
jgi:hypothetical protein